MMDYWPWYIGAIALAAVAVGHYLTLGKRFGVSSCWERVVHWTIERDNDRADTKLLADSAAFDAALRAATLEQFGEYVETGYENGGGGVAVEAPPALDEDAPVSPIRIPVSANALLLASIAVGSLLAGLVNGRFELRADMGPDFAAIVTDGWLMWPILFLGGILVGVGTRMAGGCSSGHGLGGVSRLQTVSILSTAVFFGTASIVSFLLWKVI